MNYLLDTHTWIWYCADPDQLSKKARSIMGEMGKSQFYLSAISLWEFSKLTEKGKLRISVDGQTWLKEATEIAGLEIVPISSSIAWHSCNLPQPFHHDPADQIIVATAREQNCTIITKDRLIQSYKHVLTVW